jgi:hypothetical protein
MRNDGDDATAPVPKEHTVQTRQKLAGRSRRGARLLSSADADKLADVVATLFVREKSLDRERHELRVTIEEALREARQAGVQHKVVAAAIIKMAGLSGSEGEHDRLEQLLRQRTLVAFQRVRGTNTSGLAMKVVGEQAGLQTNMESAVANNEPVLKTKIVTETRFEYAAPDPVDNHDHDLDVPDESVDDDEDDSSTAARSPSRNRRR